jgi:muconolactone delta-isomerase
MLCWNIVDQLVRKALEVANQSEPGEVDTIRKAEAAASRSIATESALKPIQPSNSWWPSLSLWAKDSNGRSKPVGNEAPQTEIEQKSNDKP